MKKKNSLDWLDIIVYGSIAGIILWFILKSLGVIKSPVFLELLPLGLVGIVLLGIYNRTERIDEKFSGKPIIKYRKMTKIKAKKEIEKYLEHKKEKVWIEDVINDLKIEPEIVVKVIRDLGREGKIK